MNEKVSKSILKSLVLLPIGLSLWVLINGVNLDYWGITILAGFVISFGIIFWNIFDYEKLDNIDMKDFLESSHSLTLKNKGDNWESINEMVKNQFVKLEVLEKSENHIKVQVHQKIIDSILTVKKSDHDIVVEIYKKHMKFMPDKAQNYKILKRIEKGLSV
ncbi:MAG: hypothetical protein R3243_02155 [Arenibacter latericius]|nr:hypothetical protein [Arenibacter latericius]